MRFYVHKRSSTELELRPSATPTSVVGGQTVTGDFAILVTPSHPYDDDNTFASLLPHAGRQVDIPNAGGPAKLVP